MNRGFLLTLTLGVVVLLAIPLTGCAVCPLWGPRLGPSPIVTGSQEMATWEYDFADFTSVNVSSAFTVDITRSDSYRVSITANENLSGYLDVRKVDETLYIGLKRAGYTNIRHEATITMPELRNLGLFSASRVSISGFSSSSPLELDVSGASSLNIGDVVAGDAKIFMEQAGRLFLHKPFAPEWLKEMVINALAQVGR